MQPKDLRYKNLEARILSPYANRATTVSGQFLLWFLENFFNLEEQDADDANVDSNLDKGVDGLYVADTLETIYVIQSKTRQKSNSKLGDTDIKEFYGTLNQFREAESVAELKVGNAHVKLKNALNRLRVEEKLLAGYSLKGIFCTNVVGNDDAHSFIAKCEDLELYDAERICLEYVDSHVEGGIQETFSFDISDSNVIDYVGKGGVEANIFLAKAKDLVSLSGISDSRLFSQNVRLSLGNTKINKGLVKSVNDPAEHANFPLYHNGITMICDSMSVANDDSKLTVTNYVVVNGAQSITSIYASRESITDELSILTKVVALHGREALAQKITHNSNNQNAIKARDMRSNHQIQIRIKSQIESYKSLNLRYEIKRGENNDGFEVLTNEDAGLILLAMDLEEPWRCHQKYRVMDDSHSRIFGRPEVDGAKIVVLYKGFKAIKSALTEIEDKPLANYNLTKYFLAYCIARIIKSTDTGKRFFDCLDQVLHAEEVEKFNSVISGIAETCAVDLNAEVSDLVENEDFDYKADLKSVSWCKSMSNKLLASYQKDVKRKKVESIDQLVESFTI